MSFTAYQPPPLIRGSSLYYATLYASQTERSAVALIADFYQMLQKILYQTSEERVAKLKLNWWLEELHLAYRGNPRHPLSQALIPCIQKYALRQEWFLQIINSMQLELEKAIFADQQALLNYCCDNRGTFHLLIASIFSAEQEGFEQFAILSGVTHKLISLIRYFGLNYRQGKIFLPQSELDLQQANPASLMAEDQKTVLLTLLMQQYQLAKTTYQQALILLPIKCRAKQCSLLTLMNISLALLEEIQQENFHVFTHKYSLTPLRKWWIAWRTFRRAQKNQLLT